MDWCRFLLVLSSTLMCFALGGRDALSVTLNATVEVLGPLETQTLWQLPPEGRVVRKVLVILCGGAEPDADPVMGPYAFWDPSPSCALCSGQPENRKIVSDALSRDYAVIAPAPLRFPAGTWSEETWPLDSPSLRNVLIVISTWKGLHGLQNVPTVAVGASAGGEALATLALQPGFLQSITIMISRGTEEAFEAATEQYPPTLFMTMTKDQDTDVETYTAMRMLQSLGVEAKKVQWFPPRVMGDWFATLIPWMNSSTSEAIVSAFKDYNLLDENNYLLCLPDTCGDWLGLLCEKNILPGRSSENELKLYASHIAQEMKVAFAEHTTFSRKDNEMFAWFEAESRRPDLKWDADRLLPFENTLTRQTFR